MSTAKMDAKTIRNTQVELISGVAFCDFMDKWDTNREETI